MDHLLSDLLQCNIIFDWSAVMPIVAIVVSIFALFVNRKIAQKNICLSIQQAIFKTVSDKAKDCNTIWENEPENERNENSPHYKVVSEMIISKEVIAKSFYLFKKNYESIKDYENDYYYLLWKQLRSDLRDFIRKAPILAEKIDNQYFSQQIRDLHAIFKEHFETIL